MHICLITPSFPPQVDGGVAIATGRLVAQLLHRGHQLTVLTTAPTIPFGARELPSWLHSDRLTLHYGFVADPLHRRQELGSLWSWVQQHHRQHPVDILLAYFVYPGGYLGTWLGARLRLPVVCSCRGNDISKDMFMQPQVVAGVLRRSTHLLFVSHSLLDMADTLYPCRSRATCVPNAVDATLFTPGSRRPGATPGITIGTSGVMRWKKGLDLLLPLLRALCRHTHVRLLLAGYGLDAAVTDHMQHFVQQHDLHRQVEITGPLLHERMVEALRRMDVYVSPSYQEGMPNGILEAMACALPVVASDADGIPELVVHGVTGYLCRRGELQTFIARCQELMAAPHTRQRMGTAGRQRVLQAFRPEQEAAAVERVLQAVRAQSM